MEGANKQLVDSSALALSFHNKEVHPHPTFCGGRCPFASFKTQGCKRSHNSNVSRVSRTEIELEHVYYNQRILWFTLLIMVSEYVMSTTVFSTSSNTHRNIPEAGGFCPEKSPFLSNNKSC
jgi:hypothetical protein